MTPKDPRIPDRDPTEAWPQGDALDRALSASLRAPALPAGFHAALSRAIEIETERDLLARRRALEVDHARRLAELRAGYVSVRSNTLAIALAVAFTARRRCRQSPCRGSPPRSAPTSRRWHRCWPP